MKIITGKTANEHVNSEDDRGLYAGIFGNGSYVLNTGTKLQASIESSTTIRINSGDLVHQGCHARIPYSEYDEVTIDAGTTGYKRIDLIVARYEKNAGLENMSLIAIKGQPAASDPVVPDYNHGNIQQGSSISDMPLYKIQLDGVNVESITPLWDDFENTLIDLSNLIERLREDLLTEKAEREEVDENLYGGIRATNENLEDCESHVAEAQSTADDAQTTANAAQSAADDAQTTADAAVDYITNKLRPISSNASSTLTQAASTIANTTDLAGLRNTTADVVNALASIFNNLTL